MKKKIFLGYVSTFLIIAVVTLSLAEEPQIKQVSPMPNIEGTYKLISRKLPDGTIKRSPDVMGLLTYTKSSRNFNVLWKDDKGKLFSYSLVSTYKLTSTEYSETIDFSILNDQISGKEINYDLSGQTRSAPVKLEDGRIQFKAPFDPPLLVFEGNKITAIAESMFVDIWEKIQ